MNSMLKEKRSDRGFFARLRGAGRELEPTNARLLELQALEAKERQKRPFSVPAAASGAVAVGALALGAVSIGALAIGFLAVRRFAIGKARIRSLKIKELDVQRLRVGELVIADSFVIPGSARATIGSSEAENLSALTGS